MSKLPTYSVVVAAIMWAAGAAVAQTNAPAANSTKPTDATQAATAMTLTEDQAKSWVDKPVYSSDNKQIGEVAAFKRGSNNAVMEMHADIGGLMGMGETRVKLSPEQFKLQGDRVQLNLTQEQAKSLPKVQS